MGAIQKVKSFILLLPICLFTVISISPASVYSDVIQDSVRTEVIVEGIIHKVFYRNNIPQVIHVVEIDWNRSEFGLRTVLANNELSGRETTTDLSERLSVDKKVEVIAGINGDFFRSDGKPVSMQIMNGEWITTPSARSVFFVDKSRNLYIDRITFIGRITTESGKIFEISALNKFTSGQRGISILNRYFASETGIDSSVFEYQFRSNSRNIGINTLNTITVIKIDSSSDGLPLNQEEWVLKQNQSDGLFFHEGEELQLTLVASPYTPVAITEAVSGAVRLVRDGNVSVENKVEKVRDTFVTELHPRTAIGFNRNQSKVYFVTVDGRQQGYSIGSDLFELASFMKEIGAYQALNLDGGGSTTMVINGRTVNRPSDITGERAVGNGIFVVRKK